MVNQGNLDNDRSYMEQMIRVRECSRYVFVRVT